MSGSGPVTHLYRYAAPSGLLRQALPRELASGLSWGVLSLATSGGVTEAGPAVHPYFFTGFRAEPGPAAQALLATAAIARAQYYIAAATVRMLRDPVVTSNTDRLRFDPYSTGCDVAAPRDRPAPPLSRRAQGCRRAGRAGTAGRATPAAPVHSQAAHLRSAGFRRAASAQRGGAHPRGGRRPLHAHPQPGELPRLLRRGRPARRARHSIF